MDVTVMPSKLNDKLIEEITPWIMAHWKEIQSLDDHDEVDVDWETYRKVQDMGMFQFYMARVDGALAGYAGYLVAPSLHHKNSCRALCDLIYVVPHFRGGEVFSTLLSYAETDLMALGASRILQGVRIEHDFGPVLERKGYVLNEKQYSKRIQ